MRCLILRIATWVTVLCAVALLLGPHSASALTPTPLLRGEGLNRAGLIVAHGDGRMAYVVVEFEEPELSGAEFIHRSGLVTTEVSFGGLGVAICAIDETGCDVSECRKRVCHGPQPDDPYWQYFLGDPDGSWQASPLGVSADAVANGAVRALVWSADPPAFPALSVDEIAAKAGDVDSDGVALTRYRADGSVDTESYAGGESSLPIAGIAAIALALVAVGAVLVRQRLGSASL